jgi:hypothetical protein
MLGALTKVKHVIHQLCTSPEVTAAYRDRNPNNEEWRVASTIQHVLEYSSKVVIKAQDKHSWLITDALYRILSLYVKYNEKAVELAALLSVIPDTAHVADVPMVDASETQAPGEVTVAEAAADAGVEQVLNNDLMRLEVLLREHVCVHISPLLDPLHKYDATKAHMVVASLLDPRFKNGQLVYMLTTCTYVEHKASASVALRLYVHLLKHVNLYIHLCMI